ncbi:hypothetical protein E4634_17345 [Mangrovimicrobium sediminis]|uniref:Uncharacterized protein n=1 Tax=Mangrovimicrobium sediminis TaxID=2562682 RepID=A0A4Z0LXS2_9GAMM|nr:hypothetical protein [Haliea sp. SAOS-164]TGD71875.1 hypothetical protein E4634_17345 [Haliea sp. SAOS-164]
MKNIGVILLSVISCMLALPASAYEDKGNFRQPFSVDSPWNKPLAAYGFNSSELSRNSMFATDNIGVAINSDTWSVPFYRAKRGDSVRKIYCYAQDHYVSLPFPADAEPAEGTDGHMSIMVPREGVIYEFYKFELPDRAKLCKIVDASGSGVGAKRGQILGARAYGGSATAGLIRNWEVRRGRVNHALAIAVSKELLKQGYVYPASSEDKHSADTYKGDIPMGSLVTIDPSIRPSSLVSQPLSILIVKALQEYGGYIVSAGGTNKFILYSDPDVSKDMVRASVEELQSIVPYLKIVEHKVVW